MPKEIRDTKLFLQYCQRTDAKELRIKYLKGRDGKKRSGMKLKLRCNGFLYTLKVADVERGQKFVETLNKDKIRIIEVDQKKK